MTLVDPAAATRHFERAITLYRGPFLADEPYTYLASDERHRLAGLTIYTLRVLTTLARVATTSPRSGTSCGWPRLSRSTTLCTGKLIQALLGAGRHSDAKRHDDNFAHRLRRDLGQEPDFDVRSLSAEQTRCHRP